MKPVEILDSFKQALGDALLDSHTVERSVGVRNPQAVYDVWTTVPPERLHDAVAHLCREFNPHISVISGDDLGDELALNYHFTVGWSERAGEITFTIRTVLKKSDLRLPTITDLFPGALTRAGKARILWDRLRRHSRRSQPVPARGRDDPPVAQGP